MGTIPTLEGRIFNIPLCVDCWDSLNPERKATPEARVDMLAELEKQTEGWDKDDVAANRCPVCDTNVHNGIYVRVSPDSLRALRKRRGF